MSNAGAKGVIKNTIAKAIKERVIQAKKNNEKFRVYIFIPLMPGFEGDVLDSSSQVLKLQIRFQQETILKGPCSLYTMLKKAKINPLDYIRFYGLRNHDMFKNGPKTEMIYIHSKCLIVDDRIMIAGSANINDRSMLGTRDSEIAILIQDEDLIKVQIAGEDFEVGKTVHEFRKRLMAEHYGTDDLDEVSDPLCEEFFQKLIRRSEKNTKYYRDIFKVEPDDRQTDFDKIKQDREEFESRGTTKTYELYQELAPKIKGHIVDYPIYYLQNEDLELNRTDMANLVPKINFT